MGLLQLADRVSAVNTMVSRVVPDLDHRRDLEAKLDELKMGLATLEPSAESWLTRNWRPITALSLVALLYLHTLGLTDNLSEENAELLLKAVIGFVSVYSVGRTLEKSLPGGIAGVFRRGP